MSQLFPDCFLTFTPTTTQFGAYTRVGCDSNATASNNCNAAVVHPVSTKLDFASHRATQLQSSQFPPCDTSFKSGIAPRRKNFSFLIPAPPQYKTPFKWPMSRDYAWYSNVPHRELSIEKAIQNWIQVDGDLFRFPGGGTMFPWGADAYIDDISELIPLADGTIRTEVDTGCGVASFGACLFSKNILTMSFAPRDTHEAQVQFALERGFPCNVRDHGDGLNLAEVDRILRPGGYWVLPGPPVHWKKFWRGWERTQDDLKQEQDAIEDVAKRISWKKVIEKNNLLVWQKPINHIECTESKVLKTLNICKSDDPDTAWYRNLEACVTPLPEVSSPADVAGGAIEKWPERAYVVPPRISNGSIPGITAEKFKEDNKIWKERVAHYKRIISPLPTGRYRNIMDMNAHLGGFAAAMLNYPVWVMNVDWCEAFSTYPRTYDLIHASGLFTIYQDRCDITYILLETDRILRPEGTVIFRDTVDLLVKIKSITDGMRWKSQIIDHESGPFNPEKNLVAVKTYWTGEATPK
ncbi:putative methyltransferase PMT18 [Hibiscus syriacus]|uniref:Methyltransferase n=1 Tax=Hibiscus syriacus TaxID=106335 RepID=A0A6A3CY19_HIBSY|nr:putative methyltransferase PMT18 [Hibiscus syriacus]